MTKRPNWTNDRDACCACGTIFPTPKDHEKPGKDKDGYAELHVWQPDPMVPPQWICFKCKARLEADERRVET